MRKSKGFTLIELLAVIVVLAVISLIAVPIILNIVETTKKEAFERSVVNASRAFDYYLAEKDVEKLPKEGVEIGNLDLKGNLRSGKFRYENYETIVEYITDGVYCAYGSLDNLIIEKSCNNLDITEPIIDETKLIVNSTSSTVTVVLLEDFAKDVESNIKEYKIELYNGNVIVDTIKTNKSGIYEFNELSKNQLYKVKITVTNGKLLKSNIEKEIVTKNINEPEYIVSPEGFAPSKTVEILYEEGYTSEYSIDGGKTWNEYTEPIKVDKNETTIIARLSDGTNYVTGSSESIMGIDDENPSIPTSIIRYGSKTGVVRENSDSWSTQNLWWGEFNSIDNGVSGIDHYEYSTGCTTTKSGDLSINGHTYQNGTIATYCIRAVDKAGNTSEWSNPYYFKVDTSKPTTPTVSLKLNNDSGSTYQSDTWTNQFVYHTVTSSDDTSGIAYYQYSLDGKTNWSNDINTLGWNSSYNSDKTKLTYLINWSGAWNFYIRSVDNAGNISDNSSLFTVKIDNVTPNALVTANVGSGVSTSSNVTMKATSTTSNISGYTYQWYEVPAYAPYHTKSSNGSFPGFTLTTMVENGIEFTRASFEKTSGADVEWRFLFFPQYPYIKGNKYILHIKGRTVDRSYATYGVRHASYVNDWAGTQYIWGMFGGSWSEYNIERVFSEDGLTPGVEIVTGELKVNDSVPRMALTIDYRDVWVEEVENSSNAKVSNYLGDLLEGQTSSTFTASGKQDKYYVAKITTGSGLVSYSNKFHVVIE